MTKYKKGRIIRGTVTGIESYGAFVSCDEYYSGLIHISEISHNFVKNITDYVNVGDVIFVEILEVDEELGQLKLSIKNIEYKKKNIVKRKKIELKPIDEEEAITQMELLGHTFFVFKNVETDKINVCYKRKDGDYGIIEAN